MGGSHYGGPKRGGGGPNEWGDQKGGSHKVGGGVLTNRGAKQKEGGVPQKEGSQ